MFFTEYELLELFDGYKSMDPEIKMGEYYINYEDILYFKLFIMPYEDYAAITLRHKNSEFVIFNIGLNDVQRIICKEGKLFFYKLNNEEEPFIIVQIKPNISVSSSI